MENYFGISEVAKKLSERGYPRHHKSIGYRWADRGVRGQRLKSLRVGAKRVTTEEWLDEFLRRLNSRENSAEIVLESSSAKDYLDREGL